MTTFLFSISQGIEAICHWVGRFLFLLLDSSPVDEDFFIAQNIRLLLPLVGIGAAFTIVKFGIRIVKSFSFGF